MAFFANGPRGSEIRSHTPFLESVSLAARRHSKLALKNYQLWWRDPHHPSLRFRRLQGSEDRFTVRVGDHYRALGRLSADTMTWVWIGTHADYDRLSGD
jgi:hypothetical protein